MHELVRELFPICRSITGDGVRETLARIGAKVPLDVVEVPSGTPVFDWTVPKEWNIREAYIRNPQGEKVVDFRNSNLHVVSYSTPVRERLPLNRLKERISTLPEHPDWIPYRTSYYEPSWGFCMAHRDYEALEEGEYEVLIDSSLEDGALTYGEYVVKGASDDEVLVSTHCCHPSMCNDNLSGLAVATFLAQEMAKSPRRLTYRFLFLPVTIGAITWLARNEKTARRIRHGLVLACVGDGGPFHYKKSRRGEADIDRAAAHVLGHADEGGVIEDFVPYGYDERQFCSPGFDLPVGRLTRTPNGRFPEYHTSADDLDFVRPDFLESSLARCMEILHVLEGNRLYRSTNPKCEPQLGRRGLMGGTGGEAEKAKRQMALLWVLNLADGSHDLLSIADRSGLDFPTVQAAAEALVDKGLLEPIPAG
jgi:aminopeptidase-like protein